MDINKFGKTSYLYLTAELKDKAMSQQTVDK